MAGNNRDRLLKYLEATFSRGLPALRKKARARHSQ